ncbi:HlyD family secretion protein [Sulfuricurvum sp.]|jgi:HlyD family secretion protein|uniref:HlyD family secretion protein n=1 Tax=Sulfuricurvum sp. TaxID=2025608 RepID=UPI003BB19DA0
MQKIIYKGLIVAGLATATIGGIYLFNYMNRPELPKSIAFGNGRIEATEVDIATKIPGRLIDVSVNEGDAVKTGQIVAKLDTDELNAKVKQAQAQIQQARENRNYALAIVRQRQSELNLARKNLARSQNLYVNNNISLVQLQQHESALDTLSAALAAAKTQIIAADNAISAALAQKEAIETNIDDSTLKSPVNGRVLYKILEVGEVIGSGGKVLTVLEIDDIYMTIFLPTADAGRVKIGSEARIKLDALDAAIPARVSFISPEAQFTPKEIETESEREKLMFRIKVKIDPTFLKNQSFRFSSGTPGIAHIRLDEKTPWPDELKIVSNVQ